MFCTTNPIYYNISISNSKALSYYTLKAEKHTFLRLTVKSSKSRQYCYARS